MLSRVEIRRVRWKLFNRQSGRICLEKGFHGSAGMVASAILDDHDVPARLLKHIKQKRCVTLGIEPAFLCFVEKTP